MDWKPYDDDNSLVKKKRFQSESWVVQTHWHCYIQTVTHEIAELKGYSESVRRMLSEMSFMIPKWKHWRAENHEFSQQQIGNSVSNSSITMQKYILLNRIFFRVCVFGEIFILEIWKSFGLYHFLSICSVGFIYLCKIEFIFLETSTQYIIKCIWNVHIGSEH